ncbi:MAG: polysaccharide deacetylase family protein [Anaerolineales bacterium]|nr:polysaccharide deacetylase family protein [Anaerolineales bacterium]
MIKRRIFITAALVTLGIFLVLYQFGQLRSTTLGTLLDDDVTYVSLRFDDGWKSQLNAHEALKKQDLTGSIYIISGFMGDEGYMDWSDVETVSETMEIGGHTVSHADLRNLETMQDYEDEIGDDYRTLVDMGFDVRTFVYPYGNYSTVAIQVLKKYYICASTQDVGVNTRETDLFLLRDFTIRSFNSLEDMERKILPGTWTILTFHDVGDPHPDANSAVKSNAVSVPFFNDILEWLKASDIQVITVAEGCEMMLKVQGK